MTGVRGRPSAFKRFAPVVVLVAGFVLFFALGLHRYVSADALKAHHETLSHWVDDNMLVAPLVFALVYVLAVAFSVPGASVLTILGGFLFGAYAATAVIVVSATVGATAVFLAARYAFYDMLSAKTGPYLKRFEAGFNENGVWYMLILRLVPLFPFWLVNIAPAFLGVSLRCYVVSTLVGIVPGTFVYALVGAGLDEVLAAGGDIDFGIIFSPAILGAVIGLAVLAALPILFNRWKKKRGKLDGSPKEHLPG
jgi:uncharacterized membrane protein YdjX (TVP38/TMEM64 family)